MSRNSARRQQIVAFPDGRSVDAAWPAVELTVEIEYLNHIKPAHRDTDERRAQKARVSAIARQFEGIGEYEYGIPVERWTADDLAFVIDMVRADMPTRGPDGFTSFVNPDDPFQDGRAIVMVRFGARMHRGQLRQDLWFSTAAGYAATILLPAELPAAALVPFCLGRSSTRFFECSVRLYERAITDWRRRSGAAGHTDGSDDHAA
jgi:hypothetical protein